MRGGISQHQSPPGGWAELWVRVWRCCHESHITLSWKILCGRWPQALTHTHTHRHTPSDLSTTHSSGEQKLSCKAPPLHSTLWNHAGTVKKFCFAPQASTAATIRIPLSVPAAVSLWIRQTNCVRSQRDFYTQRHQSLIRCCYTRTNRPPVSCSLDRFFFFFLFHFLAFNVGKKKVQNNYRPCHCS